jgi:hypothetical protein
MRELRAMHEKTMEPAQYEPRDVTRNFILIGFILVSVCVAALALIAFALFPSSTTDRLLRLPLPEYPQPRLQTDPRADWKRFHDEEIAWLHGSGWLDRASGVAHIPIEQAMRETAQSRIADWPGAAPSPSGSTAQQPTSSAPTEASHAPPASSRPVASRGASRRKCWTDTRNRRHCIRTKGGRAPAT